MSNNEPMTVEEIPADQLVIMNEYWHRAFNAAGCDPGCHNCERKIEVGMGFKLATVEKQVVDEPAPTREVMLCAMCTAEMYNKRVQEWRESKQVQSSNYGCFRINGKIIH